MVWVDRLRQAGGDHGRGYVERLIHLPGRLTVRVVWGRVGRHGVGCCAYLYRGKGPEAPPASVSVQWFRKGLSVVEFTGRIGIVGKVEGRVDRCVSDNTGHAPSHRLIVDFCPAARPGLQE